MNTSFASHMTDYVALQGIVNGNSLHVQGIGPSVNRDYGLAVDLTAPADLITWVKGLPRTELSGTGSKNRYAPMQAAIRGEKVHFQVSGDSLNRSYGAAFDVTNPSLVTFIQAVHAKATEEAAQAQAEVEAAEKAKVEAKEAAAKATVTDITLS